MLKKIMLILALLFLSSCANPYEDREEVKYEPADITIDVSKENLELIKEYLQHNKIIEKWITDNYISQRYIRLEESKLFDKVLTFKAFENRDFLSFDYSNDYLQIKESYFIYKKFSFIDENKTVHDMNMYIQNQDTMGNYHILLNSSYATVNHTIRSTNEYSFNPKTQTFTNPYFHNEITIDEKLKHTLLLQLEDGIKEYEELAYNLIQVKAELISMFTHDTQKYIDYSYEYLSTHYYKNMQVVDNQNNTKDFSFQNYEELVELLKNGKPLYREHDFENPKFTIQLNPETFMEVYPFAIQIYDKTNCNTYSFEDSTLYDYMNSLYNYELLNEVATEEIVKPISDKELFDLVDKKIQENQLFKDGNYDLGILPYQIYFSYSDDSIWSRISWNITKDNILDSYYYFNKNYPFIYELEDGSKHEASITISSSSNNESNTFYLANSEYVGDSLYFKDGQLFSEYEEYSVYTEEMKTILLNQYDKNSSDFQKELTAFQETCSNIITIINQHKSECLLNTDKCSSLTKSQVSSIEYEKYIPPQYPEELSEYLKTMNLFLNSLDTDLIHLDDILIQRLALNVPHYTRSEGSDVTKYTSKTTDEVLYLDEKYHGDAYNEFVKASDIDALAKIILPNSEPFNHHDIDGLVYCDSLRYIAEANVYRSIFPASDGPLVADNKRYYIEDYTIDEDEVHIKVRLLDLYGWTASYAKDKNGNTYRLNLIKGDERNVNTFIKNNLDLFAEYEFILQDHSDSEFYIVKDIKKLN